MSFACFTSPPTGRVTTGAAGCLLSTERPALSVSVSDSVRPSSRVSPGSGSTAFCEVWWRVTLGAARRTSPSVGFFTGSGVGAGWEETALATAVPPLAGFDEGCALRAGVVDKLAGAIAAGYATGFFWPTVLVCTGELFCAAGFTRAEGFVGSAAFPWGCDGSVTAGTETAGAGAASASLVGTSLDCWRMYHQPPPANSRKAAAIAPTKRPLLEVRETLSVERSPRSSGSSLPNEGAGNSTIISFGPEANGSVAISSILGRSAIRFGFSFSTGSSVEAGTATLRARGSSQAGIFSSSSSSEDFCEGAAILVCSAGFVQTGPGSGVSVNSTTFAAGIAGVLFSATGRACECCTGLAEGVGAAPEKSKLESSSCKRAVCCFSASVSGSVETGDCAAFTAAGAAGFVSEAAGEFVSSRVERSGGGSDWAEMMNAFASAPREGSTIGNDGSMEFSGAAFTGTSGFARAGATGAAGVAGTVVIAAGIAGLVSGILGVTIAAGALALGGSGCGAAGAGGGAETRSPGKRIPQKPTTGSVNSSST